MDFLEQWQRAKLWWLGIAGAAAGGGHQGEAGEDECGGDAVHGCEGGVWSVRGSLGLFCAACLRRLVPVSENFFKQLPAASWGMRLGFAGLAARQKKAVLGRRLVIALALSTLGPCRSEDRAGGHGR